MTARQAAYQVVLRVFEDDAYAARVLRSAAKDLDSRDHALAQRLAFGTVQRARTLDHAIDKLGKRPVRKLDPPVRAALRLGAYQLGYTHATDLAFAFKRTYHFSPHETRGASPCCQRDRGEPRQMSQIPR